MAVILDVLASYVQNMLMDMAREELHMLLGVSGDIKKMDIMLMDLKNFLVDADRRYIIDHSVQTWVRDLRDIMFDATDILDLCQIKAVEQEASIDVKGCFNPLLFCMRNPLYAHDIGSRIKKLNQRLERIRERSTAFNFINLGLYEDHSRKRISPHCTSHETSGELNVSSVVGEKIHEDTQKLVDMLTDEKTYGQHKKVMVFAIVGIGGIGKTTLAQKIFNDDIIQLEFTKKIWLSVTKDYNNNDLLRSAITAAGGDHHSTGNTKSALEQTLKETVKDNKILLIMDDVWDHMVWEDVLETPLVNALSHGSRVLITTRHDIVARGMKAVEPYHHVQKLEPDDAWSLLKKQILRDEIDDEHEIYMLKDIGMGIIEKCDCLPLAVKVMGGLLRHKRRRRSEWEKVLNDSMWSISGMPEQLNNAIYLSYEDLHPSLKQCFLHFSLLPRGAWLHVDGIVGMWISEGFIQGNSHELEELGREYYDELLFRNLIEPDQRFMEQNVCKMHDVIHSFAQFLATDEALVAHIGNTTDITSELNSRKLLRLSLSIKGAVSKELEWSSLQLQKSLRTLLYFGHINIKHGDSLHSFSSLRTLVLYRANCAPLVQSLYHLKHLRFLCMVECGLSVLPENICKMKFLQHINICDNKGLVKLPGSFVDLSQLRYLNLTGTRISNIPRGFKVLNNLRKLYGFPAYMDGEWCSMEELRSLSQLIVLGINTLENVSSLFAKKVMLAEKVRLSYLVLGCTSRLGVDGQMVKDEEQRQIEEVFDELCPPLSLDTLEINSYFGQRLPKWMMSATLSPLNSLRVLLMEDIACCTQLPDGLCQLPCLEHLQIRHAPAIERVGPEFLQHHYHGQCNHSQVMASFPRLRRLYFMGMLEWQEWEWEVEVQAMPILEDLLLQSCRLRHIPRGLVYHTRALRELCVQNVKHLSSLENFSSVTKLEALTCPDLETITDLPKLHKLIIFMCPKLKALRGVTALYSLELTDYAMETFPKYLQHVNPRHLQVQCNLSLLTLIAAGKSSPEWNRFSHIQHVKASASDEGLPKKWYVQYTRGPFNFDTNISRSAILRARQERQRFAYLVTCPIEEEFPVGRRAYAEKCQRRRRAGSPSVFR